MEQSKIIDTLETYQQGKSHQLSFSESSRVVKHPLELVNSDDGVMPRRLSVVTIIISVLLMLIVGLHGFIFLSGNLMCSMFSSISSTC